VGGQPRERPAFLESLGRGPTFTSSRERSYSPN
jgi:hypothetical protein